MKILFAGGGTGGHFYPIIAVAQAINDKVKEKKLIPPKLYFMSPTKYNARALIDNEIEFIPVPAGKIRRYFSTFLHSMKANHRQEQKLRLSLKILFLLIIQKK